MAPKHKSTPSRNSLRSKASSSSNPTPSSIRFHVEDARKDFSKNFSQQGVHLERWVILSDFSDTDLPTVIHGQGWESLCDIPITYPSMLIQEFYSNMHGLDSSVPLFHTSAWGLCPKMRWFLLSASVPLIGAIVSLHHVRPLLKVLDSWIWW